MPMKRAAEELLIVFLGRAAEVITTESSKVLYHPARVETSIGA